jgi:hypothetical protein
VWVLLGGVQLLTMEPMSSVNIDLRTPEQNPLRYASCVKLWRTNSQLI